MPEKNPYFASTFAERKAIREAAEKPAKKAVQDDDEATENKAVKSSETKARKKS